MTTKNKFIANRDFVMSTLTGHSVAFIKGEPTHVPPECHREALAHGAVPAGDEDVDMGEPEKKTELTPDHREEMLKMALADMKARNTSEEFTANGNPKVKTVAGIVGFEVSASEITALWTAMAEAEAAAAAGKA